MAANALPGISDADRARIIALATGETDPTPGMERHFVRVIGGRGRPATRIEQAWFEYWVAYKAGNAQCPPQSTLSAEKASWAARCRQLSDELQTAVSKTGTDDLAAWAKLTAELFGSSAVRRVSRLADTLSSLGKGAFQEVVDAVDAFTRGRAKDHFVAMADRAMVAGTDLKDSAVATYNRMATAITKNPSAGAQSILGAALGFLAGSGGIDADGGAPDLDIPLLGIGEHRSLFTHSILIGVTIETAVMSLIDLNRRVHSKLPPKHDVFWDNLLANSEQIGIAFSSGASSGVAYHLFVDATLQPGAFHGLPFAMPMEAHQALLMTNSIAEGLDAVKRGSEAYVARTPAGEAVEGAIDATKLVWEKTEYAAKMCTSFVEDFVSALTGRK